MKWPQFELWRLFAATGLFGMGLALLLLVPSRHGFGLLCAVAGLSFLSAAVGIPFRRGVAAGCSTPIVLYLIVVALSVLQMLLELLRSV